MSNQSHPGVSISNCSVRMELGPAVWKFSAAAAHYDRPILVMGPLIPSQGIEVYNDSSKNVVVVVVVAVAVVVLMIF